MRIGIDIDGVLVDWSTHVRTIYREWFNEPELSLVTETWDSLIDDTHFADWGEFYTWAARVGDRFWADCPPVPGAQAGIVRLYEQDPGLQFALVTNRPGGARAATEAMVGKVWPKKITQPELHFVEGDKSIIDCAVYIEDSADRLEQLVTAQRRCVRMAYPYNTESNVPSMTWAEIPSELPAIAEMEWEAFEKTLKGTEDADRNNPDETGGIGRSAGSDGADNDASSNSEGLSTATADSSVGLGSGGQGHGRGDALPAV